MHKTDLDKLLTYAVEKEASDIHLTAGLSPMFRVHGALRKLDMPPIAAERLLALLGDILSPEQKKRFDENLELDFAYAVARSARFRTNIYRQARGPGLAFRVIPERVRTLEDLKCPPGIYHLAREHRGLVLVTGPAGSGKTTTLAAMLDLINSERKDHILTIEDPIEYLHRPKNCLVNQREIGEHSTSFANALRAALREDPDVILVGEMRDTETIALALTAAETGHLVFASLHTLNAAETVNRIVDVFPPAQQGQVRAMFANSLSGIIAQRLLPNADGRGRTAAHELLIATTAVRNLIRENKSHQIPSAIQTSGAFGMQTLDAALRQLYRSGTIAKDIAEAHAQDKNFVTG